MEDHLLATFATDAIELDKGGLGLHSYTDALILTQLLATNREVAHLFGSYEFRIAINDLPL